MPGLLNTLLEERSRDASSPQELIPTHCPQPWVESSGEDLPGNTGSRPAQTSDTVCVIHKQVVLSVETSPNAPALSCWLSCTYHQLLARLSSSPTQGSLLSCIKSTELAGHGELGKLVSQPCRSVPGLQEGTVWTRFLHSQDTQSACTRALQEASQLSRIPKENYGKQHSFRVSRG